MAHPPHREEWQQRIKALEKEIERYKSALEKPGQGEKWFSQIVRGTPIATFVIDRQHRIINCNRAYENLTGIPAEKIIGTDNQWMPFMPRKGPSWPI